MILPPAFTPKCKCTVLGNVILTLPNRAKFSVQIIEYPNDRLCLEEGWASFRNVCSIQIGHFLVFEYDKNSIFTVHVFDESGMEIEYSRAPESSQFNAIVKIEDSNIEQNNQPPVEIIKKDSCEAYDKAMQFASAADSGIPWFVAFMQKTYVADKYNMVSPPTTTFTN